MRFKFVKNFDGFVQSFVFLEKSRQKNSADLANRKLSPSNLGETETNVIFSQRTMIGRVETGDRNRGQFLEETKRKSFDEFAGRRSIYLFFGQITNEFEVFHVVAVGLQSIVS